MTLRPGTSQYSHMLCLVSFSEATRITVKPQDVVISRGHIQDVVFKCGIQSDPSTPLTVRWLYNQVEITPQEDDRFVIDWDHSLHVRVPPHSNPAGVRTSCIEGRYTCIASTRYTKAWESAILRCPSPGQKRHLTTPPYTLTPEIVRILQDTEGEHP